MDGKLVAAAALGLILLWPKRRQAEGGDLPRDWGIDDDGPEGPPDRGDPPDERDERPPGGREDVRDTQELLNEYREGVLQGYLIRGDPVLEIYLPGGGCGRSGALVEDGVVGPCSTRAGETAVAILIAAGYGGDLDDAADRLARDFDFRAALSRAADRYLAGQPRPVLSS